MLDETREEASFMTGEGAPDTKDAEALAAALNHSAERVQTLWFSFLTFMVYLAIAAGTTTHRILFLENQLNLPVLNIALPLLGFYILTPIIFVVFHFYMLLNLVLLARTAKSFEDALVRAFPEDGEARENFRMRIENTLFVQLLVGGKLERKGLNAKLLSLMALITLAVAPVALLLFLQIIFLPYHDWRITWLHRGLLAIDLALVWTLWPGYRSNWGARLSPKKSWRLAPAGAFSALTLAYAAIIATFPDEWMYRKTNWVHGKSYRDFETGELKWDGRPGWYAWSEPIVPVNALDLHGQSLIDGDKLENINKKNKDKSGEIRWEPVLVLKDRDLTEADLSDTDIRQIDSSGKKAVFDRATLNHAWAKQAHFSKASFSGAHLAKAQLQGARLDEAQFQGAVLDHARLQGVSLEAQLEGAFFDGTCVWRTDARKANWKDTFVRNPKTNA